MIDLAVSYPKLVNFCNMWPIILMKQNFDQVELIQKKVNASFLFSCKTFI